MRVTFTTVNRNVQRNLSRRYSDMVNLQEQLATGKRLRKPSDNPIDVANDIKLRTKQAQLKQYKRNIEDGMAVMNIASSAMGSMNELLHRARELAVQAANDTNTETDREYMQQEVNQIFRQMMSIINTQFKGNYVFNGTNTKTPPYLIESSGTELTDYRDRKMATYGAELDITMRSGAANLPVNPSAPAASATDPADVIYLNYTTANMKIGDTAQLMWNSSNPDINSTAINNIMPGSFPLDTYDINGETFDKGTDYAIDYKTGKITVLSEAFRDALNSVPFANRTDTGIDYTGSPTGLPGTGTGTGISFDIYGGNVHTGGTDVGIQYSVTDTFQIIDGKFGEKMDTIFPGSFNIKIGGKEYVEGHGEHIPGYYDENGVYHKGKNDYDYSVDYETGKITIYNMDLLRDMRPEWLGGPDLLTDPNAGPNMYKHGQLAMSFDYITRGMDIYGEKVASQGDIWRAIEEGISTPINMRADEMLRDKKTGYDMVGTLLRYNQALLKNDREGIQSALDELSSMYDTVLNSQSDMGARIYRFELTLRRNEEQYLDVSEQQSALEDADLAEVISRLMLAENVYNASLQAAMRVIQPSLANFM